MQDPTGREGAASYYPGSPEPISAPTAPQPARWGNLPQEMRERRQWLLTLSRGGKTPHTLTSGGPPWKRGTPVPASVTNPAHWLTFEQAAGFAADWFGMGIGYVLSADDPFTCVDLDVKDDTTQEQLNRYWSMVQTFGTYTERSQSGRGLHLWCEGKIGKGARREGVEVYSQERFIVCTGDVVHDKPILDCEHLLHNMVSQMRALGTPPVALVELPPVESDGDHWHRKASASNGEKFQELWFGRWEVLGIGDGSQSCADLALVRMLCFNNPSNEQVRCMFRLSALGQRKKAQRVDYVDGMIATARSADAARAAQFASAWGAGGPPSVPAQPMR